MSTPKIRVVKVRLPGQDDDVGKAADLLARLLPALSQARCQVGEVSPPYPNRRGSGTRRYFGPYPVSAPDADTATTRPGRNQLMRGDAA